MTVNVEAPGTAFDATFSMIGSAFAVGGPLSEAVIEPLVKVTPVAFAHPFPTIVAGPLKPGGAAAGRIAVIVFGAAGVTVRAVRFPLASYVYVMTEPSGATTPTSWPEASCT